MTNRTEKQNEYGKSNEQDRSSSVRLTRCIILLLFFDAGMKAWPLAAVPAGSEGLISVRGLNIFFIEFELLFGLLLLFGFFPLLIRWTAIVLFSTLAGVSLSQSICGESGCGCFGITSVHPWLMMGLNLVIAGLLSFYSNKVKPCVLYISHTSTSVQWFLKTFGIAVLLSVFVVFQELLFFNPFIEKEQYLTDREITFTWVESGERTQNNNAVILVRNKLNIPVEIVGAKIGCSTGGFIQGLPVVVPSGGESRFTFVATNNACPAACAREEKLIPFFVDANGIKKVNVLIPPYK